MPSACTEGGAGSARSPFGLLITRPVFASCAALRGRKRKVTSLPASSSRPPKYPPSAPAPTTRIRMNHSSSMMDGRFCPDARRTAGGRRSVADLGALEAGRPLFEKGGTALVRVLAVEDQADHGPLVLQ